jgi:hypothetical protein
MKTYTLSLSANGGLQALIRSAISAFVAGMALLSASQAVAALQVAMMPSYGQSPAYGNAQMNTAIEVWGRAWGGTANYNCTLDYGDGTSFTWNAQSESQVNYYIGASHTYTTSGRKTVTLTVTDASAVTVSRQATINVIVTPTHAERINMAIEKGLLYMYKLKTDYGDGYRYYWNHPSGSYNINSCTAFNVLAFEENGHLPNNNDVTDIYAMTARRGMNYLLNNTLIGTGSMSISSQTYGNPDSNGNGVGRSLYGLGSTTTDGTYISALTHLAFIMSQPNGEAARTNVIAAGAGGPFNTMTFSNLLADIYDQYAYAQGDASYPGGFGYTVNSADGGRFDGSSQGWMYLVGLLGKCYELN